MTSSWDDMKRVREEEYFHKQEIVKKDSLKNKISQEETRHKQAQEKLEGFKKGDSPITGAPFFKAIVQGHIILDCPEDDMILLSHSTLLAVMETLQKGDKQAINAWKAFLDNQVDIDDSENK
tara:strand:+ start:115991 stop:116356 length:366 start_codon:yes stop_codon:yes gene_type:complete